MLYTGKGDSGTTKLFNTPSGQRIEKTHPVFEALGTVDELGSFLGIVKVKCEQADLILCEKKVRDIIHHVQENLFIIQAELAGSEMSISEEKIKECEDLIAEIEQTLPPIKTFFISGGTELASFSDTARAIIRRAERSILRAKESEVLISQNTCTYINRLSSLLYAIARYANHQSGIIENKPSYE